MSICTCIFHTRWRLTAGLRRLLPPPKRDGGKCSTGKLFDNFGCRWVGFCRTTSVSDNFRVGQLPASREKQVRYFNVFSSFQDEIRGEKRSQNPQKQWFQRLHKAYNTQTSTPIRSTVPDFAVMVGVYLYTFYSKQWWRNSQSRRWYNNGVHKIQGIKEKISQIWK